MAPKLKIPGTASDISAKLDELKRDPIPLPFTITVQEVIDVTSSARAAGGAVTVELTPPPDKGERQAGQVCEVELDGGITLWLRPGSLYRDFGAQHSRGTAPAGSEDVWEIAPVLSRRSAAARGGAAEQKIRRVTVYKWDRAAEPPPAPAVGGKRGARGLAGVVGGIASNAAAGLVADKIAGSVGRAVERHQLKGNEPGLYRVELGNNFGMTPSKALTAGQPILLFLHGTMSSCEGSFKGLWDPKNSAGSDARGQFARRYGQAFAWEHYTLTESPIKNALDLIEKLPDGARLHLVSHSRGGLVGDLLCLGQRVQGTEPLSPARIGEIFELAAGVGKPGKQDDAKKQQAAQLRQLIETLEKKKITVERFVRVASPSRGTTLASGKLDRWLSVVKLLNDLVLPFNFPLQLLISLIAEHDDPSQLPGLEAMMPGSPLVRILNFPALQVTSDLSVISGDTEGKGLLGRLKELMLDQFFEDECDIVVNTGAMFGGLKRVDGGRFYLDSGSKVSHFSYFNNGETVRMLAAGLMRIGGADAGFRPISLAPEKEPARAILKRAPQGPLPVVFVLPGIMGSTLEADGDLIWLGKLNLMLGKFGKLEVNRDVTPKEPFKEYYGELMDLLRETHEVIPFPYDWRHSILKAGEALAKQINAKLDEIEQRGANMPVCILAHSLGGLVARAMIARKPEVWRRMAAHNGGRLIMLGTPNGGSYEIVRLLTGYATTLQQLTLLDFTRNWNHLLEIIVRFPGVLELLPIENNYQYFGMDIWEEFWKHDDDIKLMKPPMPDRDELQQARRTWETILAAPLDPERTLYVAGQAKETPIAWRLETEIDPEHLQQDRHMIVFEATARGDGKVPWDTGIPQNIKTWYLPEVEHGDLPAHEEAFPAYLELLQSGATARLTTTPPAGVRATALEQRTIMDREMPATLPDERELAGSVLGAGSSRRRRKKATIRPQKVKVSIIHGNLAYSKYPVIVGHYAGDTIVSAEDYLDQVLHGRLREHERLGLYPGTLGTCELLISLDQSVKPAGAIVIGLGRVGELSPGILESAMATAALRYALHVAERQDSQFSAGKRGPRSARLTSLLIGTGTGGITMHDSLSAILRGVKAANKRLYEQGLSGVVWIDYIEFMELWQDKALQAATALERVMLDGELTNFFLRMDPAVWTGPGSQRRVVIEDPANWWHRLEIVHDSKKNELRFISLTDRARAEESLVSGQLRLADDFIRQSIADTSRDNEVSHTLFEMLYPNRLKELAPDQFDVVLVVDEVSGSYPWELLDDRWSSRDRPVSVASGMLRQLKTGVFRERPTTTLEDTVYVVGDPLVTGESARIFPSLEGARKEAVAVADFLQQNGFTVTRQIRSDASSILSGLHHTGYRVLHLAGHGVHEEPLVIDTPAPCEECEQTPPPQTKKVSGMVIGDKIFLTPGDIEQMRWVPELVFINCCHLGKVAPNNAKERPKFFHRLAANIAAQFIRMGVKAVVAAGWAVDDAAAETFATCFYRHLLAGDMFGEAVRAAREETYLRHENTNTWGAFQCYGDPSFHLRAGNYQGGKNYLSPTQVAADLENLANRARMGSDCRSEVDTIVQTAKDKNEYWLERPEVAAALGIAYGELGLFKQAIEHLDKAIGCERAEYSIRIVEQRANFKSRWAVELKRGAIMPTDKSFPERLIKDSIDDLDRLLKINETAERLSLMGSAHKRNAWITTGKQRKVALSKMATYYRKAHFKKIRQDNYILDTYTLLNWLAAECLQGWYGENTEVSSADFRDWSEWARAYAEELDRLEPNFWNSIVKPECDLVQALADATLDKQKQAIVDAYLHAKARGASPREFRSVIDHLEFLADMAAEVGNRKSIQQQAAALREIVEQLAPLGE